MNILLDLKNETHDLHNAVEIIDDYNIKNFKGETINVYTSDLSKFYGETLGREIVFNTLLEEEKDNYFIESVIGENDKRYDAMAKIDNHITNIIEFKNINFNKGKIDHARINNLINDTKNQLLDKYLIPNINEDIFVSIILTDVEHMIREPRDYFLFCETAEFYKVDLYQSLKDFGISIITFKYNSYLKSIEYISNNIQRHAIIEKITNKQLNKKNMPFQGEGMAEYGSKISHIIKFPTTGYKSSSIENVREIKSISEDNKLNIVTGILDDLIINYKNNPNDFFSIFEAGHHKYFQYISEETIIKENNTHDRAVICTLDGAMIDGQNSVNSFSVILDIIDKYLRKKSLDKHELKILNILKKNFNNSQMDDFSSFVKNQYIRVSLTSLPDQKTAIHSAIVKNTSMKVKDEELLFPIMSGAIKNISRNLFTHGIFVQYPKKKALANFNTKNFFHIYFNQLVKLIYTNINLTSTNNIFKMATDLSSELSMKNEKNILNTMKQDGISVENKDKIIEIDKEIEKVNIEIQVYNNLNLDDEVKTEKISECNNKIKDLSIQKQKYYEFIFKDLEHNTTKIIDYCRLISVIDSCLTNKDMNKIVQCKSFNKITIWKNLIYIIIFNSFDDISILSEEHIKNEYEKIYNRFNYIFANYDIKTTSIRNNTDSVTLKEGREKYIQEQILTVHEIQNILCGKKDVNQNIIFENNLNENIDNNQKNILTQEELIPIFSHLFMKYKKDNIERIKSKTLFEDCKVILNEGVLFPVISKKYDVNKHKQIINNFTSNRTFEQFSMAEYDNKKREFFIL